MEDSKLEALYDSLKRQAPKGKTGGLGFSGSATEADSKTGSASDKKTSLYSHFIKSGEGQIKKFTSEDAEETTPDSSLFMSSEVSKSKKSSPESSDASSSPSESKSKSDKKRKREKDEKCKDEKKEKKHKSHKKMKTETETRDASEVAEEETASLPVPVKSSTMSSVIRLHNGHNLVDALESIYGKYGACFIQTCVGGLSVAKLKLPGSGKCLSVEGDLEIVSLAGTLGKHGAHLHMIVSDPAGQVYGGHAISGSIVRRTAEIVVGFLPDIKMKRKTDPKTGNPELKLKQKKH